MKSKIDRIYDLEKSPLYKLQNKRKLALLLDTDLPTLQKILAANSYSLFTIKKGKKERNVQAPKPEMKKILSKLRILISRISTPDWLISGKKGVSYIDNAKHHQSSKFMVTLDISAFYQSSRREFVFRTLHRIFKMAADVAWLITDLVTYDGYLPTGSPTSQIIAYWAYQPTFMRIKALSDSLGLTMTLYVDDLSFSNIHPIPGIVPYMIQSELKKVGLKIKRNKTKFFGEHNFKIVTGVAISPHGELLVPNRIRNIILSELKYAPLSDLDHSRARTLFGRLIAARQIERDFLNSSYNKIRAHPKI